MPRYPGDIAPDIQAASSYEDGDFYSTKIQLSVHTGTHIDAPYHMLSTGKRLSDYPIEYFSGRAVVIPWTENSRSAKEALENSPVRENDIVLVRTGHSRKFYNEDYYSSYPVINRAFAAGLLARKIKILGLDTPSPDYSPFRIHHMLFAKDVLIIENLINLDRLPALTPIEIIALPMALQDEGAPIRVMAILP